MSRRGFTGLLAALITLELVVGGLALQGRQRPVPSSGGPARPGPARSAPPAAAPARADDSIGVIAVRAVLARRSWALLHHDRAVFLSTVDPRPGPFRTREGQLYDNLRSVPLSQWRYDSHYADMITTAHTAFARYGGPVWGARVQLQYALAGVDQVPTSRVQFLTFVERDGRWYLCSDSDFAGVGQVSWKGLWDYGPVVVAHGQRCLVLAHPRYAGQVRAIAAAVDAAVPRVTAVWGPDWSQQVAVLLPDTQQEMNDLVGDQLDLAHIAAVASVDEVNTARHQAIGQRVVLNPANLGELGSVGRDVVLRHELTHIASRSVTGPAVPTWLKEGFADYVGYLHSDVPTKVAARELAGEVAAGKVPSALPGDDAFAGTDPRLSQTYEEAWLACRLIADRAGTAGLVRFYRLVGASTGEPDAAVRAALGAVLHESYARFVTDWRASLVDRLS